MKEWKLTTCSSWTKILVFDVCGRCYGMFEQGGPPQCLFICRPKLIVRHHTLPTIKVSIMHLGGASELNFRTECDLVPLTAAIWYV